MRIFSILAAIIVAGVSYLFIMERETVLALAGVEVYKPPESEESVTAEEVALESEPVADPTAEPERVLTIVAIKSAAEKIEKKIILRGRTEAARHVEVRAETSGLVVSEPLRKGAFVEEGTVLCELATGTRGVNLAEAEVRLAEAEENERAATKLATDGFVSEARKNSAVTGLRAARTNYERAQEELSRLVMVAPFDGMLETDSAEIGSLLMPGSLCATVINLDPIKLVGFVPEAEVDQIAVGNRAKAKLVSGREVTGIVTFISRSADLNTRTFGLEVEVANEDLSIRDGATAEISIESSEEMAHLLPQSALTLNDEGDLGIRTVAGGKAKFFSVSIVRDTLEGVWVTGLPDAADIIVVGQEFVVDGSPINVVYREAGV